MSTDNLLKIDPDNLTLGDIEMIEEISGQPIGWLGKEDKPQGKMMVAIAYTVGLAKDPNYTMAQARKMRVEVEEEKVAADSPSLFSENGSKSEMIDLPR